MTALQKSSMPDFAAARFHMVESQIRPNKVMDERILDAMSAVPREMFVPSTMSGIAYIDKDLEVAPGRYLLEPMVLARLLQEAEIRSEDSVLDIAPATGYSTTVIAALAKNVLAIESDPGLYKQAHNNLNSLQIKNANLRNASLTAGWPEQAPYDVIVINGGVEFVPDTLTGQLAEGGRLVVVARDYDSNHAVQTGAAQLYQKIRGYISHRVLFDANVKPLAVFEKPRRFTF